jgi:predicted nucleotidyltransferase
LGLSLDTSLQIAGYRTSVLRDGLRGYMRTHTRANMLDLKSVFPHRKDGAILLEECLDRGLFDRTTSTITPAGQTIAEAKVTPRAPLAKAQAVLKNFLERAQRLARDPDAVSHVEEIWLFGSVLRGEETVGDIDLALSTARCERFRTDPEARRAHVDAMLARHGKGPASPEECWKKEARLERYALYGERRHPLLSGARTDFLDLAALAVPCQLIYDRKRGGRVDDPILPRHPTSEGRSPDIVPLALLPDLSPSPIRPMDAAWLAAFRRSGQIVPFDIYRSQLEAMRTLFSGRTAGLCAFTDGCDPGFMEWVPDRAKQTGLDGRTAALLISAEENGDTSLVLNRRMDLDAACWTLHAGFDDVEFFELAGRPGRRQCRASPA